MNPQENRDPFRPTLEESLSLVYWLAQIHALAITVFIRTGFGAEGIGLAGVGTLFLLLFCVGSSQDPMMALFLLAWLGALGYQRYTTYWNWRQGVREHSQYGGYPWLAMKFISTGQELRGKRLEPLLCLPLGMLCFPLSRTLGMFVVTGVLTLSITTGLLLAVIRRRIQRMRDAEIEMRQLTDLWENDRDFF